MNFVQDELALSTDSDPKGVEVASVEVEDGALFLLDTINTGTSEMAMCTPVSADVERGR